MSEGAAIALAGVGLVLVYLWTRAQPAQAAAPPATTPAATVPNSITGLAVDALLHPSKYNELIFGVGPDTFKSWDAASTFDGIKSNMRGAQGGSGDALAYVKSLVPDIKCTVGNCDENPVYVEHSGAPFVQYKHDSKVYEAAIVGEKYIFPCGADDAHKSQEVAESDPRYQRYLAAGGHAIAGCGVKPIDASQARGNVTATASTSTSGWRGTAVVSKGVLA